MRLSFLVNPIFDGWEATDTRLGGTEESIVEWGARMADMGHSVTVWRNSRSGQNLYHRGVFYRERDNYFPDGDVCINVKSPEKPPIVPTIYLTNETDADRLDLSQYACVVWPSEWAKKHIAVNNPKVFVVPHGYDPAKIYPEKKIRKQCFYASSPDRGLSTLLEAWPKIYQAHPDATLIVTYGGSGDSLPGVMYMGDVDEETMNQIYRTSEYWLHPCSGGELFGITGIKAQAAGCWPVYFPTMALSETVKFGTVSSPETFASDVIAALSRDNPVRTINGPTWDDSTKLLMDVVQMVSGEYNAPNRLR